MNGNQARNLYRQTASQAQIHPVKLIHLMYERVLVHLEQAAAGIAEKSPSKRGEHVGKAIALVTELSASVKQEDQSEAAQFLRSLYSSILAELPKVSLHNDLEILKKARTYIARLKEIWEQTAMRENGLLEPEAGRAGKTASGSPYQGERQVDQASPSGVSVSI